MKQTTKMGPAVPRGLTATVAVRLTPQERADVIKRAEAEDRDLSSMLRQLLRRGMAVKAR